MRNPENVLNSLQEHSAQTGYVYDRLYRNLFNRELFLQAYQNIYANQGNMTAGTDGKTIDAMSMERQTHRNPENGVVSAESVKKNVYPEKERKTQTAGNTIN